MLVVGVIEFGLHGRVTGCEALDGYFLQFLIGKGEVISRFDEVLTHFLEVRDSLINLVDGILESVIRQAHITSESIFERHEFFFEIGDIDLLRFDES